MGRARLFDEPTLLGHAQEAFWSAGYDRTSIEDISRVSGVGNGSIYAAYGSKLGLFLKTFERYCAGRVDLVRSVVDGHTGQFQDAVAHYFDAIVAECTSHPDRRGCLMLNSLAEIGPRSAEAVDLAARTIEAMEQVWIARIRSDRAAGTSGTSDDDIRALAAHIVLVSQGLIQLSRTGASGDRLRQIGRMSSRLSAMPPAA